MTLIRKRFYSLTPSMILFNLATDILAMIFRGSSLMLIFCYGKGLTSSDPVLKLALFIFLFLSSGCVFKSSTTNFLYSYSVANY